VALALPLLGLTVGLALLSDLSHRLPLTLALLGSGFLWLVFICRRLETAALPGRTILLGSLLLRLPLLLLPLTLSDDALRYLWDGKVALNGLNPYALPPAAPELIPFRDELWQRLPHTEIPTVYPPLSITLFSIASRLPFPILGWKLLATAADLGTCALLLRLARRRGLPEGRIAWYAWNPLVLLEVSGMGHVDALGVAATVGAVLALTQGREVLSGIWAAAGALAKIVPVAALPMWTRQSGVRLLGTASVLIAAAVLPVIAATGGIPPGLLTYGLSWEFNGPIYEPLWRLMDTAGLAPAIARGVEALERRTEIWYAWDWVYPYLYPQLLAKLLLAAGMAGAVLRSLRETDPVAGTGRLFGTLLLLSATVYPWYLLWVLPWAALLRQRAWLALSGLILLSYLTPLWPWVFLAIWVPFWVLMLKS
jgi:hypothetical protein